MIGFTFALASFSTVVACIQIQISHTDCGYYAVGGYLAAIDVLLGAFISFAHCYYWSTGSVLFFTRKGSVVKTGDHSRWFRDSHNMV